LPASAFAPADAGEFRARHGIAAERPVALFVGRVAHEKNIDFLLQAFSIARRSLPDLLFLITGEGPARADLEQQATLPGGGAGYHGHGGHPATRSRLPHCAG
jgi:glycosyltransferase involved in cell wall biosynthesis